MMSSGSEEARRIKQRIHECNEASQDQRRGIQSSTYIPIPNLMDEPPLRMQRAPAPYFMNGQSERPRKRFAYESPIEELYYDRSVVPMEKPLKNKKIEAMI